MTLDIQDTDRVQLVNEKHFNQPNQAKTEPDEVIECMKKRAKEETTPLPKIYQEALCAVVLMNLKLLQFFQPFNQLESNFTTRGENDFHHYNHCYSL